RVRGDEQGAPGERWSIQLLIGSIDHRAQIKPQNRLQEFAANIHVLFESWLNSVKLASPACIIVQRAGKHERDGAICSSFYRVPDSCAVTFLKRAQGVF